MGVSPAGNTHTSCRYLTLQSRVSGGVLAQAIEAVIPLASTPQAVVCALRAASLSLEAVAVAQFRAFPNLRHI
jgi:hypothetical protein